MLFLIGLAVGAFGTLIGAGGGFLLVPVLILLYPTDRPETLTSISLAVVFLNALSGTVAYARMKRIDYRSGLMFAAATIPGAVLGALVTTVLSRRLFDVIFGVLLTAGGAVLLFTASRRLAQTPEHPHPGHAHRVLIDADGTRYTYSFRPWVGIVLSLFVGMASSLLGIGGGIIHVPALIYLLDFPAHVATATSHFILVFMALAGTAVHVARGTMGSEIGRLALLGSGALLGAQIGARWSERVHGAWIVRSLAIGLIFVGVRILLTAAQLM